MARLILIMEIYEVFSMLRIHDNLEKHFRRVRLITIELIRV